MDVRRFDFNGTSVEFTRTAQGFLRVNARLTKTGVFSYENGREYRCEEEVFRADSLASIISISMGVLNLLKTSIPSTYTRLKSY